MANQDEFKAMAFFKGLILHQCRCEKCGKTVKAQLSKKNQHGYGPRLSALIAELSGIEGSSCQCDQGS